MRRSNEQSGIWRLPAAAIGLLLAYLWAPGAQAVSPPDMPLPSCVEVNGEQQGACPYEFSERVTGTADKRIVAGEPVIVTTVSEVPRCNEWDQVTNVWTPSTCYNRIKSHSIGGCVVIDLQDGGRVKRMHCVEALYKHSNAITGTELFDIRRPADGYPACGVGSSFSNSYPITRLGGEVWANTDSSWLDCEFTLKRKPDGLYGPTWVAVTVGVDIVSTGCCNADPRYAESHQTEIFIPIDGDMRFGVDVGVDSTAVIQNADWDNGRVTAAYRATVQNHGGETAENVMVTISLPKHLKYMSVSDASCLPTEDSTAGNARAGRVVCSGFDLPPDSSRMFEVIARVVNATDLDGLQKGELEGAPGVRVTVQAADDGNPSNNTSIAKLDIPFRSGSYAETKIAMEALAPYFDYKTDIRFSQCNVYKDDIFRRFEEIRAQHPEVFANLSYGGITSGEYDIAFGMFRSQGHVGVVVYTKGTNYRETGIIVNGTPSNSPLSGVSLVGPGDTAGISFNGSTSYDGRYLRTAANLFPGFPTEESNTQGNDYGFEGRYAHNRDEFGGTVEPAPEGPNCPFAPDAVTVTTESPVEIIVTNSRGQRVETQAGKISIQELDSPIHSMAFPHMDGTFGWTLVLPVDDYDVQLRGTQEGAYRLTLTTYDEDGTPNDVVTSGTTTPGQVDTYQIDVPDPVSPVPPTPPSPPPPTTPATPTSGGSSGGGGAFDVPLLMSMTGVLMFFVMRRRRPRRVLERSRIS